MSLETGTYISDLVVTNPAAADPKSEGDNHIRLIKETIKNSFPAVSGAVTPTHTELNYVDGVTSAIQTQLDAKAAIASPTFTGTPSAPTATPGTNTTQLATTAFVTATAISGAVTQAIPSIEVFTSNGTWVCPTGVVKARVTVIGGGGSSGSSASYASGGAGGGTAIKTLTVTPGVVYTVTIGAGGVAVSGTSAGNAGGSSSFSGSGITTVSATGGGRGNPTAPSDAGGTGTNGDLNINGETSAAIGTVSPMGGGTFLSPGGPFATSGSRYGEGGGGMGGSSTGVAGADGVVIVEY